MDLSILLSGVRDKYWRGNVGDFLKNAIQPGADRDLDASKANDD